MQTPLYILPAALLLMAAAVPLVGQKMTAQAAERGCEVRATKTAGGVSLQAVAFSDSAGSGEYELIVEKSGGGGSSNTSQGGDFEVGSGGESVLSEVTLSGGGSAVAELTVTWSGGGTCKARYPDSA
ncbi:MAG: hypothetical protein H0T75_12865 [Rhizobiales bacterium]|nr:hypothetical protein [Hyphomicrobiales bacterium]